MNWITCSGCGLKHSPRPDGLCPRCRTRVAEPGAGLAGSAPGFPGAAQSFPSAPSSFSAPGEQPLVTTPVQRDGASLLEVGPLVSRTFSVWWTHVGKFAALLVLAYVPFIVAGAMGAAAAVALKGGRSVGSGSVVALIAVIVVAAVAGLVLVLCAMGGLAFGTLQHLAARPVTFGSMFGAGYRRAGPLLLVTLLSYLLVLVGLVALVVPGIILGLGLALVFPIVMTEPDLGAVEAMKRSLALTKGSRWSLFGALFVVFLAMWGASLAGNLLGAALKSSQLAAGAAMVLSVVIQVSMSTLSSVLCAVAYHDLRLAKEGVDTSDLAKVFE